MVLVVSDYSGSVLFRDTSRTCEHDLPRGRDLTWTIYERDHDLSEMVER